jgi:hypothetical protein
VINNKSKRHKNQDKKKHVTTGVTVNRKINIQFCGKYKENKDKREYRSRPDKNKNTKNNKK